MTQLSRIAFISFLATDLTSATLPMPAGIGILPLRLRQAVLVVLLLVMLLVLALGMPGIPTSAWYGLPGLRGCVHFDDGDAKLARVLN